MKKLKVLFVSLFAFIMTLFTGCNLFNDTESLDTISKLVGVAAGKIIASEVKADQLPIVREVVSSIKTIVPATNETYEVAWTSIINAEVDKFVVSGKLDAAYAPIIKAGCVTIAKGLDYIFIKHPDWKSNKDKVDIVIKGFFTGVDSQLNSVTATKKSDEVEYDKDAFKYLSKK